MTFSIGGDEEKNPVDPKVIEDMFKDYASFTGIEFVAGDQKHGSDAYFQDLIARAKRGGSGLNPKNIDLVIVRSEEHTSELQSRGHLVCRLLLEKKKNIIMKIRYRKNKKQ